MTKTEIKIKNGQIIKVGDMFNGIYSDDTCGAYVVSIYKPYGRWLIKLQCFDHMNKQRAFYACKFHANGLIKH